LPAPHIHHPASLKSQAGISAYPVTKEVLEDATVGTGLHGILQGESVRIGEHFLIRTVTTTTQKKPRKRTTLSPLNKSKYTINQTTSTSLALILRFFTRTPPAIPPLAIALHLINHQLQSTTQNFIHNMNHQNNQTASFMPPIVELHKQMESAK
jgi:hypothetical protein